LQIKSTLLDAAVISLHVKAQRRFFASTKAVKLWFSSIGGLLE